MGAPKPSLGLRLSVIPACLLLAASSLLPASPSPLLLGVSPQDEEYFARPVIPCRDGSKSFAKARLNDGFCDCADGTDEPGTSACPESKFYCRNVGDAPRFLFSSRVNDRICDCCDGSDEYDGGVLCPHTCIQGGEDVYFTSDDPRSAKIKLNYTNAQGRKSRLDFEDLIQNLNGLEGLIMIQLISAICVMTFCLFCRLARARRRQSSWTNWELKRDVRNPKTPHALLHINQP